MADFSQVRRRKLRDQDKYGGTRELALNSQLARHLASNQELKSSCREFLMNSQGCGASHMSFRLEETKDAKWLVVLDDGPSFVSNEAMGDAWECAGNASEERSTGIFGMGMKEACLHLASLSVCLSKRADGARSCLAFGPGIVKGGNLAGLVQINLPPNFHGTTVAELRAHVNTELDAERYLEHVTSACDAMFDARYGEGANRMYTKGKGEGAPYDRLAALLDDFGARLPGASGTVLRLRLHPQIAERLLTVPKPMQQQQQQQQGNERGNGNNRSGGGGGGDSNGGNSGGSSSGSTGGDGGGCINPVRSILVKSDEQHGTDQWLDQYLAQQLVPPAIRQVLVDESNPKHRMRFASGAQGVMHSVDIMVEDVRVEFYAAPELPPTEPLDRFQLSLADATGDLTVPLAEGFKTVAANFLLVPCANQEQPAALKNAVAQSDAVRCSPGYHLVYGARHLKPTVERHERLEAYITQCYDKSSSRSTMGHSRLFEVLCIMCGLGEADEATKERELGFGCADFVQKMPAWMKACLGGGLTAYVQVHPFNLQTNQRLLDLSGGLHSDWKQLLAKLHLEIARRVWRCIVAPHLDAQQRKHAARLADLEAQTAAAPVGIGANGAAAAAAEGTPATEPNGAPTPPVRARRSPRERKARTPPTAAGLPAPNPNARPKPQRKPTKKQAAAASLVLGSRRMARLADEFLKRSAKHPESALYVASRLLAHAAKQHATQQLVPEELLEDLKAALP